MKNKNIIVFVCFLFAICNKTFAQEPDKVYQSNIGTVQFFPFGDQTQLPIYNLGSETKFQLNFDDRYLKNTISCLVCYFLDSHMRLV